MKKIIYSFLMVTVFSLQGQAQSAIPNGNFESWTTGTYDVPQYYMSSNPETFYYCNSPFNVIKTTDFQNGAFAVQLLTNAGSTDTCFGYIVNSPNPGNGNPCNWSGGTAYNQVPTGIQGYYKNNTMPGDSSGFLVAFRNGTTCLGLYLYKFAGTNSTYTPFSFTFNPPIAGTPDTMVFAAVSSDAFNNVAIPGSMFQLDNVTFTGASQPVNFNGDFELWQSVTADKANNWYAGGGGGGQSNGVLKTTDKYAGTYAVELVTHLGDNNGVPRASGAFISTGYYLNNCSGPNCQRGGYPFTNQIDTLCFYYKFAPSGSDTANVWINFKNNGNNVWGAGDNIYTPTSVYQYREIPFNTMTPIDSVIVSFQSSAWQDSLLSFIGTNFKVDEAHFKSQPLNTGIQTFDPSIGVKVFPNPSADGKFMISNVEYFDLVRVYNVYGQEVDARITKQNHAAQVQINAPGAYTVFVNSRGKVTTLKVIVGKE